MKLYHVESKYTDDIIKSIQDNNFKVLFCSLNEVLTESHAVINDLQEYTGFINEKFKSVQTLIKYVFKCLKDIDPFIEVIHKKCLTMYSEFCRTHEVNVRYTNSVKRSASKTHLIEFMT